MPPQSCNKALPVATAHSLRDGKGFGLMFFGQMWRNKRKLIVLILQENLVLRIVKAGYLFQSKVDHRVFIQVCHHGGELVKIV